MVIVVTQVSSRYSGVGSKSCCSCRKRGRIAEMTSWELFYSVTWWRDLWYRCDHKSWCDLWCVCVWMLHMFRQLHAVAATNRLQIRLRTNKSHHWPGDVGASTDGALNSELLPWCQRSTGTPEGFGILDRPCTELLQTFMNRTIYASIFPSPMDGKLLPPNPPTPPKTPTDCRLLLGGSLSF